MHRRGHYGSVMLTYAPVAFVLTYLGAYRLLVAGWIGVTFFAMIPDLDMRIPSISHRGPTHTIWFAALFGLFLAGGCILGVYHFEAPSTLRGYLEYQDYIGFSFLIGVTSVLGHLLGDVVTVSGLRPLTPFSNRKFVLEIGLLRLPTLAKSPVANWAFSAVGYFLLLSSVAGGYIMSNGMPAFLS